MLLFRVGSGVDNLELIQFWEQARQNEERSTGCPCRIQQLKRNPWACRAMRPPRGQSVEFRRPSVWHVTYSR